MNNALHNDSYMLASRVFILNLCTHYLCSNYLPLTLYRTHSLKKQKVKKEFNL